MQEKLENTVFCEVTVTDCMKNQIGLHKVYDPLADSLGRVGWLQSNVNCVFSNARGHKKNNQVS